MMQISYISLLVESKCPYSTRYPCRLIVLYFFIIMVINIIVFLCGSTLLRLTRIFQLVFVLSLLLNSLL